MKNYNEIHFTQDHEGTGHQMQPTSRLASLDFHRSAAPSAHMQMQILNAKHKSKRRAHQKTNINKIGTFNVQGLLSKTKQLLLTDDFFKYKMKALLIQETHMQGNGFLDIKSSRGKTARLYYCGHQSKSTQGVGILVKTNVDCSFTPVSSRILMLKVHPSDGIDTCLISAYAPTSESTNKNPESTAEFYNELSSVISKVKEKEALVIGGDFNAKTKQRSTTDTKSTATGRYCKNDINQNGELLLEFAEINNLKITNTFFKHRPAHITTWQCPLRTQEIIDSNSGTTRKNPYRNQIDYILIRNSNNIQVFDSRSYGGFTCNSDHKPVIAKLLIEWRTKREKKRNNRKINSQGINLSQKSIEQYQKAVKENLQKISKTIDLQKRWNAIKECTTSAAIKVAGYKGEKRGSASKKIQELSNHQKLLHHKLASVTCQTRKKEIKKKRNKILNEIHHELKKEENENILSKMKPIEQMPDDPNKTYKVIKELKRLKPKTPLLIKTEQGLTANEEKQTEIIAKYFKDQFHKNAEKIPNKTPQKMRTPFTADEIKNAVMKMRNGTTPGVDKVTPEMIKYGPKELYDEIAKILNDIAETGIAPKELTEGIIAPLQKANKQKGPVSNLRPITLLSILRKILASCLCKRTNDRMDKEIPIQQAAYRPGRSTTEHVFATKLVIERITASESGIAHLLLLDMSKAFDTIQRKKLVDDLEQILEPDEIHLICKMLEVKLAVKCGNTISPFFETDTGGPQGDSSSAKNFIFYLAKTLNTEDEADDDEPNPEPEESESNNEISLDQQYADDISKISTNEQEITNTILTYPPKLAERGLLINQDKTEKYSISRTGNQDWKKCKLLGTLLDTSEEIKRRKILAIAAAKKLKSMFDNRKIWTSTKARIFDTYVSSIFLYNASTWTITETQEKEIDAFQRKMIRINVLNIKWPKKISNNETYHISKIIRWSCKIKKQRLNWFGHVARMHPETPAKKALRYAKASFKRPRGRPKERWTTMMERQLNEDLNLSWDAAENLAQDRTRWRQTVNNNLFQ